MFKKAGIYLLLAIASMILHNVVYAFTGIEEPVFFLLTFGFGIACIVVLVKAAWAQFRK